MSTDAPKSSAIEDNPSRSIGYWLTIVCIWALFGFWNGNQIFIDMRARGMHHSYPRMIVWAVVAAMQWVPMTPVIFGAARRFPIEKHHVWRSLPFHIGLFLMIIPVVDAIRVAVTMLLRPFDPITVTDSFGEQWMQGLQGATASVLFVYVAVTGVGHAIEYRRRAREKELRAAQLEVLLAQAQMLSLKMQLHPHFLFNTLNGIVALVRERENDSAVEMLLGLSNMLRYALDSSARQEVTLSEEIDFLNLYLGVEKMRFPDRLDVQMDFPAETLNALVPSLVLQPLVENAIRHGISQSLSAGKLLVGARRVSDRLALTIEDDGAGLAPGFKSEAPDGIGLKNTRARLTQLYGDAWSLDLSDREGGGTVVCVSMPYKLSIGEPAVTA